MVIGDEGGKSSSRSLCLAVGSDCRRLLYGEVTRMVSLWNFYALDKCILSYPTIVIRRQDLGICWLVDSQSYFLRRENDLRIIFFIQSNFAELICFT